ncbi:hypothetical protein SBD_3073 [Streptomyces bottropensis ATCC 25435]|uniref:Uncharacterized protein n=1 Tax=Streptomyces bottropensis ATCC 25435 TaxID=1054862 RepID=M3FS22_9ACTN|nr:hypothetical protein SBD_3073 [Streptomyces bottropensis ATCC 25435]
MVLVLPDFRASVAQLFSCVRTRVDGPPPSYERVRRRRR